MDKIITKYNETGACEIDVLRVVKKWNHLFFISQWKDEFRLIKYKRKDSPITVLKIGISKKQFEELKDKLELIQTLDYTFKSASSWRPLTVKKD